MREITRIRRKKGIWTIEWEIGIGSGGSLADSDRPRPELPKAFDEMAKFAVAICELPPSFVPDIAVNWIAWKYEEKNTMVRMNVSRFLRNSVKGITLTTPWWPYRETDDLQQGHAGNAMIQAMEDLQEEANRYIDGDREQGKLNFGEGA